VPSAKSLTNPLIATVQFGAKPMIITLPLLDRCLYTKGAIFNNIQDTFITMDRRINEVNK
jgi:hypothetical protein